MSASSTTATTEPAGLTVLSTDTVPISIDFTQLLTAPGQTLSTPTATLTDITPGSNGPVTLGSQPFITGLLVVQNITGLTGGHTYRLELGATITAGVIRSAAVTLSCPY